MFIPEEDQIHIFDTEISILHDRYFWGEELVDLYRCQYILYHDHLNIAAFIIFTEYPDKLFIQRVFTNEIYRGRGLATNLISYLFYRYMKRCFLEVYESNYGAISLYEKLGFRKRELINELGKLFWIMET